MTTTTKVGRTRRRATPLMIAVTTMLVAGSVGFLFGSDMGKGRILGAAIVALVVGFAVMVLKPNVIYGAFAFILGGIPFAVIPGLGQPFVYILAVAVWGALLTHPITETRTTVVEVSVALLVITSFLSVAMTTAGLVHVIEFAKWFLGTSVVFALLRLDRHVLRMVGKCFALGAFAGAVFALGVFFLDKAGTTLNHLAFLGYGQTGVIGTHLRFYITEQGNVVRLTGTYVDPNAAGVFLLIGLAISVALFRGRNRVIIGATIAGALVITLSRGSIFSLVVALVLYLLFQRMSSGFRVSIVLASILAAAGALSVPAIYSRIFNSFNESDRGTNDRVHALANFTSTMSGNWWFGKGWGVREFTDEVAGYNTNYVANSPLLTVYRGGIITGLAFVGVLVAGAFLAYRQMRMGPWESGVIGAVFVGFSLVGLQLDFPVVTHAPMTMAFSVFIALLCANPFEPDGPDDVMKPKRDGQEAVTRPLVESRGSADG